RGDRGEPPPLRRSSRGAPRSAAWLDLVPDLDRPSQGSPPKPGACSIVTLAVKPPVLFVDDSALARAAAVRLLGERGLEVTALGSGAEAASVDPPAFSAALLDVELGDALGTEIAERLRRAAPALPIAF